MKLYSILSALAVCIGLASQEAHAVTCQPQKLPSNPDTAYTLPTPDDGTVTHAPTGLMWKRCSEGQSWSGGTTCTGTVVTYTWAQALAAASKSTSANYTDWRLPNVKELRSLVEECTEKPAINSTIFPAMHSGNFWSSSPNTQFAGNTDASWVVDFAVGGYNYISRYFTYPARLVRGGDYFDNVTAPTTSLLSVSANGSGTGTVSTNVGGVSCMSTAGSLTGTCLTLLATDSSVKLTAAPAAGGTFTGWSGVCSGSGNATTCTLSMNAAKNVTATFIGGVAVLTAPGAPSGLAASASDSSASLTFTPPSSGGAATSYVASCTAGTSTLTGTAGGSPIAVSGMANNTPYSCTVLARNSAGNGPSSAPVSVTPSASVTPVTTVPGAPSGLAASAGNASAILRFTPPSSGGAATSYVASCTAGTSTLTGTAGGSPIAVSGMANNTPYSCTVLARNSAGNGTPSASISVTPSAGACSYALNKSTQSYGSGVMQDSVSVTTSSTCGWTAVSSNGDPNTGWLQVTSADGTVVTSAAGTGNSNIVYYVLPNTGATRTGTLTIGGQIFTVTQTGPGGTAASAPPNCTLTASSASISEGGSSTLTASCDQTITSYVWTGGSCAGTTGASCAVTPAATTSYSVAGTSSNGTGTAANATVTVGAAAVSIIDHYYTNILNRGADAGGKAFWQSEVARMSNLGVSATEAYITMARYFFTSSEFIARGLSNDQFIQNLYLTFFNRGADQGGLAYWNGALASGLPHDMVMYAFMFSPEFSSFMTQNGVSSTQRAEIGTVIDYYRGAFGRLPDDAGLKYWVNQFRSNAQCSANPTVNVYSTATSMAGGFFNGADYLTGSPTPSKYVSDLYNAFMRRSADLAGFNYWVNQLSTKAQTYDQVRQSFIDSTEFAARVQAIAGQGCTQSIQ